MKIIVIYRLSNIFVYFPIFILFLGVELSFSTSFLFLDGPTQHLKRFVKGFLFLLKAMFKGVLSFFNGLF